MEASLGNVMYFRRYADMLERMIGRMKNTMWGTETAHPTPVGPARSTHLQFT